MLEDWIWHIALPLVAYALMTVSAVMLPGRRTLAPFGIGVAVLLLVFIGIHNAWDTVTYVALQRTATSSQPENTTKSPDSET